MWTVKGNQCHCECCEPLGKNGRYSSTSSVPLTHSSSGEMGPERQPDGRVYGSPPPLPLTLFPFASHVDLFMLKFKQLEAQLALPLGVVNRCVHRRKLSRVFSALGKPVSGSGSHSRAPQITERFRLMDRRPFSDDYEDV